MNLISWHTDATNAPTGKRIQQQPFRVALSLALTALDLAIPLVWMQINQLTLNRF